MSEDDAQRRGDGDGDLADTALEWLVHLRSGRARAGDHRAYVAWRRRSPAHEAAAQEAEALWAALGKTGAAREWRAHRPTLEAGRGWTRRAFLGAALAAGAGGLAVGLGLVGPLGHLGADYGTAPGERRAVTLPDGTEATLNTATALSLDYRRGERRVTLHGGEAQFDVARDAGRPFRVRAGQGEVRALGTTFVVRWVGGDVRTVVTEGRVGLQGRAGNASGLTLARGQAAELTADGRLIGPERVDLSRETAWLRGKLIFNRRPLGEVTAELERYQRGRILILSPELRSLQVSGVFPTEPAQAIRVLESTLPVQVNRLPYLTVIR